MGIIYCLPFGAQSSSLFSSVSISVNGNKTTCRYNNNNNFAQTIVFPCCRTARKRKSELGPDRQLMERFFIYMYIGLRDTQALDGLFVKNNEMET